MATGDKKRAVMTTDIDNSGSSYPVLSPSGDGSDVTAAFTAAASRANISTGEKLGVIFGKVAKWFSDLGVAAFRGVDATPTSGSTNLVESAGVKSAIDDVDMVQRSYVTNGSTITISTTAGSSAHILVLSRGTVNLLIITSYWTASYFVAAGEMPSGLTITKAANTNDITVSNNTGLSLGYLYI